MTSTRPLVDVRRALASVSSVVDFGLGTAEDSLSLWFELNRFSAKDVLPTIETIQEALTSADTVQTFQPILEGGGKDMARQIPLLSGCSTGIAGGVAVSEEPKEEKRDRSSAKQIPLF